MFKGEEMTDLQKLQKQITTLENRLRQKEKEIYSIQRIGKALSSTLHLDELLALIMQEINTLMNADRSTLYVADHERQEIWSKIALKAEVKEIRQQFGKGISGVVAATGQTINIPDAYNDERFDPSTDKRTGYRTRSILCMPVWEPLSQGEQRQIIGVVQLLNKADGHFTAEDEALLEALASQVAISIANARLYHRLEKKFSEIDLLYDFEQLLNSIHDLPATLQKVLGRTVEHLQAQQALAYFPAGGRHIFVATDHEGRSSFEAAAGVSAEWLQCTREPSAEALQRQQDLLVDYFRLPQAVNWEQGAQLISPIEIDKDNCGFLMACGVQTGQMQHFADERRILELIAQKIARAHELHTLRESLLKQERLSAIGQMMSTVVHDIRGPVNTIYGFVDLMEDPSTDAQERREFAGIIREEINSTMNMITEVLDFAKGKTNILPRKVSARDVLDRFKPRLQQMCQKSNTRVEVKGEVARLLYADVEKLNRVFYNIAKNAIEAMGEGGRLTFSVAENPDSVTFQLTDNGPGIPDEIRERLFESFVTSGKKSGTGLGLAIVKRIVEEHHGTIEIDSQPGQGATFTIHLPVYQKN